MYNVFTWRGEPILDIKKWAADRDERMVKYKYIEHGPFGDSIFYGEMPEHFWTHLQIRSNEEYIEL